MQTLMPTTSVICRSLSLSPKPMVSASEQPRKPQMALMPVPLSNLRLMSSPFTMPPPSSPRRDSQKTNWLSYCRLTSVRHSSFGAINTTLYTGSPWYFSMGQMVMPNSIILRQRSASLLALPGVLGKRLANRSIILMPP